MEYTEEDIKSFLKENIECDEISVIDADRDAAERSLADYFRNSFTVRIAWSRFGLVTHIAKQMIADDMAKKTIPNFIKRRMKEVEEENA